VQTGSFDSSLKSQAHISFLSELIQEYTEENLKLAESAGYSVKLGSFFNGIEFSVVGY